MQLSRNRRDDALTVWREGLQATQGDTAIVARLRAVEVGVTAGEEASARVPPVTARPVARPSSVVRHCENQDIGPRGTVDPAERKTRQEIASCVRAVVANVTGHPDAFDAMLNLMQERRAASSRGRSTTRRRPRSLARPEGAPEAWEATPPVCGGGDP